ncbi:MAG: alanine-zipper protein [Pseudomonadota bacterium]|nr:alanine-zipper protein [Pseudomonadota bacterium]
MRTSFLKIVKAATITVLAILFTACASYNSNDDARQAREDAAKALKAANEAKAAAKAAQTEKERVDRMFEQTMKK